MIFSLLIPLSAVACMSSDLSPLVLTATKNYQLEVDKAQEIILESDEKQLPKITGIKGSTPKGKPMLTVMSGLQVLEKGQMKSYPYRVSIKLNEAEKDWDKPIEISVEKQGKTHTIAVKWVTAKSGCFKPITK